MGQQMVAIACESYYLIVPTYEFFNESLQENLNYTISAEY
jgi:hypothetical protein